MRLVEQGRLDLSATVSQLPPGLPCCRSPCLAACHAAAVPEPQRGLAGRRREGFRSGRRRAREVRRQPDHAAAAHPARHAVRVQQRRARCRRAGDRGSDRPALRRRRARVVARTTWTRRNPLLRRSACRARDRGKPHRRRRPGRVRIRRLVSATQRAPGRRPDLQRERSASLCEIPHGRWARRRRDTRPTTGIAVAMRSDPGPGGTLIAEIDGYGVTLCLRRSAEGVTIVEHGGDYQGQHSGFLLVPEHDFAITLLTNSSGGTTAESRTVLRGLGAATVRGST